MIKINYPKGATPLSDCSGLMPQWVKNLNDLNRVEAENISQAQKKYLKKSRNNPSIWFNVSDLKKIHYDMLCNVWDWAGKFRKSITSIGVEPYLISSKLSELCDDVKAWLDEAIDLTFLEQSARIHHRLVSIHPFENGNGRFSRLVADRYLIAYGCSYPSWPYLQNNGESRDIYIQSLKEADRGNYAPLIKFMRTYGARNSLRGTELSKSR